MAIFDDMIEITSPGPLPDTISVEELGTGRSEIRNRILAPIFKDLKLIEAWGTGIQKIKRALKHYPEIELVLQEVGHAFQIQFRKKTAKTDQIGTKSAPNRHQVGTKLALSTDQLKILKNTIEPLPIKKLLEICDRSDRTKFRKAILNPLIDNGVIEKTVPEAPRSPNQKYVITKKGKEWLKQHKK